MAEKIMDDTCLVLYSFRGFILNEIFRRVEPKKRTMGEYLYEEINQKLGASVNIGVRAKELPKVTDLENWGVAYTVFQSLVPAYFGRKTETSFMDFAYTAKVCLYKI